MASFCFITTAQPKMIALAAALFLCAIFFIYFAHPGQKKGLYFIVLFLVVGILSILLLPCWAFVIGIVQIIIALMMYRNNYKILIT